jgi:chemotaxis protein CheD
MYAAPYTSRATPVAAAPAPSASAYVHPGRQLAGPATGDFTTVVGSGVAVCVWDPIANVAGMTHFLLPEKGNAPPAPRFGDVGMKQLVEELARLGAHRGHLRAAVFGGSAPPIAAESGHLGERNVAAATTFLAAHGIAIVQKDVGGAGGRKVIFLPATGKATVVRLNG